MSISIKEANAYDLMINAKKKISTYANLIIDAVDVNTRPSVWMNLGIQGMLDIGGKFLGRSLDSHPYFTYHKAHLEVLSHVINASSNYQKAIEALNAAIRSADSVGAIARSIGSYNARRELLGFSYITIDAGLRFLRDGKIDADEMLQITEAGQTPATFGLQLFEDIKEWRAKWCELFVDSLELLAMAQVEFRATEVAMKKFKDKMKALESGGNIGTVATKMVDVAQFDEQYYRMKSPQAGKSDKAVTDPTGYARDQVRSIKKVTDILGQGCESAMKGAIDWW